ncbi:MAG: glutamate--tRNA ligase [Bacteroidetes bacterium]|nr:glutamate--tRNA ligase [Bacteroidota bacterium]
MRVRFAPSPTGYLHIGGLRTALYNWLLARRHGGVFILRIEDTDRTRFVEDAEADILSSLDWAGLTPDEGPGFGGQVGPYRQSERSERYAEVARQLLEAGKAYVAFDLAEDIEAMRERHRSEDNPNPRYDFLTRGEMANSLTLDPMEVVRRIAEGEEHVIRLKVEPGQSVSFEDQIRGMVTFGSAEVDDQVLIKSDGLPTYHLANIVDDHDMGITHVIRGEEWLPSTPKHVLLYQAMGWDVPRMAHLPLILSPTGGKLSKRKAEEQGIPVSVSQYVQAGYEPEALVNFLALLGWNPGTDQEVFTLDELTSAFSLDRVGQSGVQFDMQKLAWFNGQWLRSKTDAELAGRLASTLNERYPNAGQAAFERAFALMKERITFAHEVLQADWLFVHPTQWDDEAIAKRWKGDGAELLLAAAEALESLSSWTGTEIHDALTAFAASRDLGLGRIMFPLRMALTGQGGGPDLMALMAHYGQQDTLARLREGAAIIPARITV